MALTQKQKEFAEHVTHGVSQTEAAKRAGYSHTSAHHSAWENMNKPEIDAMVQQNLSQRMARLGIYGDTIVAELWKIATNEDLQAGPRVAALATCAKLLGLMEDKLRITENKPNFEGFIEQLHKEKKFDRVDGKVIEIVKEGSDGKTQT